jgi:metal-sulfur cluster biosynthetic enzyme
MSTPLDQDTIRRALRHVIDPELDCNIVDLGLIYGIKIDGARVNITMTLTTPGCPMHESIRWGVHNAVLSLEDVEEVDVQVVWDPPWHPSRMTAAGREQTGVFLH